MATPALKDLPKVDMDLKSQLETFSPKNLKNASTEEKCVLPSAEGNYYFFSYHLLFIMTTKLLTNTLLLCIHH